MVIERIHGTLHSIGRSTFMSREYRISMARRGQETNK